MHEDIISLQTFHDMPPPIWIDLAGVSYCDGSYQITRDCADITVIEYVISGKGTVHVATNSFQPAAGDIYILQPFVRHHYYADPDDPWVKLWFNIRGVLIPELLERFRLSGVNLLHAPQLRVAFEQGMEIASSASIALDDKQRMLATRVFEILYTLGDERDSRGSTQPLVVRQVTEYIHQHLSERVTLKDLVRVSGISRSQLNLLFTRHMGVSPYAYHLMSRIDHARELLSHTCLRQQEIADRLGFYDEYHFSRQFSQKVGISPREYRKISRGESEQ